MSETQRRIAIGVSTEWPVVHHYKVVHGILTYATSRGWNCVIDTFIESEITRNITGKQYDGCIARVTPELAEYVARVKMPCVNVWNNSPVVKEVHSVLLDFSHVANMAIDYFHEKQFKSLAFLAMADAPCDFEQDQDFARLASEKGMDYTSLFVLDATDTSHQWAELQRNLFEWVGKWKPPLAVYTSNDGLGRNLAQACYDLGYNIPDDIAIMGAGNNQVQCESFSPTLTSIDHHYEKVGFVAAQELERLMDGHQPPAESIRIREDQIVERRSTDVLAVEDRVLAQALRFIWDNVHRSYNVDEVVDGLAVTRRSLERRFRNMLGRSINQEIIRVRVQRVKQKLVDTSEPVKAIAADCGFKNLEHLYYVFQKHLGMAPGAYRKMMRKNTAAQKPADTAPDKEIAPIDTP